MSLTKKRSQDFLGSLLGLPLLLLAGFILWLLSGLLPLFIFNNWSARASAGDMFGAGNALFSGMALAGVIYTVHLQRKELALQRRELELTRAELSRSAKAQEQSQEAQGDQVRILLMSARLASVGALLEVYNRNIERLYKSETPDLIQISALDKRVQELINQLETLLGETHPEMYFFLTRFRDEE